MNSDTPRTDAVASDSWSGGVECVEADECRKIERELIEAEHSIETGRMAFERIRETTGVQNGEIGLPAEALVKRLAQDRDQWKQVAEDQHNALLAIKSLAVTLCGSSFVRSEIGMAVDVKVDKALSRFRKLSA